MNKANKPDAVNPAIASRFAVVHHWRGVTVPERQTSSHVMQKIPLIPGLMLVAALTVHDACQFLVTDDGVGYFTSQPRRLLYVAGIALIGGLLALAFSWLIPMTRRALRLTALGSFAACIMVFLTIFASRLASFASMVTESGMWGWVIAALASLSVVAVLVWLEFDLVWRRHPRKRGHPFFD
jgi:hypothetical protein